MFWVVLELMAGIVASVCPGFPADEDSISSDGDEGSDEDEESGASSEEGDFIYIC